MELTPEEQAELDRQNLLAEHPRFHDRIKCGSPLVLRIIRRKSYGNPIKIRRYYCVVHKVYLNLSGWEIGFYMGTDSKEL